MGLTEREVADKHEFDWALRHFGSGFDPSQPRAEDGKWDPSGGSGGPADEKKTQKKRPPAKEDKPVSPAKRKRDLVKAILKALDDVLGQLTSKQAKALIERIKDNADAFIDGQISNTPGGNNGGGGKKKGGGSNTPGGAGPAKKKGGSGNTPGDSGGSGGGKSDGPAGVAGIVAGVKNLLDNFGKNMRPKERKALNDAVKQLDSMAAFTATFADEEEFSKTVCIMAVPAADDPVHGIGPEDKHATLLYFGKYNEHNDPEAMTAARSLLTNILTIAAEEQAPFTARVKGIEGLGSEEPQAKVWMLDSPDLSRLFEELPAIDSEVQGLYDGADATRYPEYTAHVTIGYGGEELLTEEARAVQEIRFDRLSLWWGNDHIDIPLGVSEFDALISFFGNV